MAQFCRVLYEGPSTLVPAVLRTFREAGVTLAAVCVADGKLAVPERHQPVALTIACSGGAGAVDAALRCFTDSYGTQATLVPIGATLPSQPEEGG